MIRRAFTMRLKPDSLTEYKTHHDNIWPELVAEIERSGIASITTFQRGLDLFLVSEIADEAAWDKLWNSAVHRRWAEVMQPLMHLDGDGIVEAGELNEVFHLTTHGENIMNNGNGQLAAFDATSGTIPEEAMAQSAPGEIFAAVGLDEPSEGTAAAVALAEPTAEPSAPSGEVPAVDAPAEKPKRKTAARKKTVKAKTKSSGKKGPAKKVATKKATKKKPAKKKPTKKKAKAKQAPVRATAKATKKSAKKKPTKKSASKTAGKKKAGKKSAPKKVAAKKHANKAGKKKAGKKRR